MSYFPPVVISCPDRLEIALAMYSGKPIWIEVDTLGKLEVTVNSVERDRETPLLEEWRFNFHGTVVHESWKQEFHVWHQPQRGDGRGGSFDFGRKIE